jgi:hypothetical protein
VSQDDGASKRFFAPGSTPQGFFSIEFFPPQQTPQDVRELHAMVWSKMAALLRTNAQPRSGATGRFIWTRVDAPRGLLQKETAILYSAKAGSTYVGVGVDATRADLVSKNLPLVENMLTGALLDEASSAPASTSPAFTPPPAASGNSTGSQAGTVGPASLGDYVYATPAGWNAQQYPDGIVITSAASATGERCMISMWPMRASSGNLQRDANVAFQDIYKTYELRTQTSRGSALPPSVIRGTSGQGWDYLIVKHGIRKPGMGPRGQWETLLGFVLVARLDNRVAVISGMSKDPLVSACMGELTGATTWPIFFYSLSFKSWQPSDQTAAMRKQLAGTWTAATATAADRFVFAGNGRYATAAAAQQYYRTSSTELLTTTQAYFGNGAYSLQGNAITLTQDDRKNQPENGFIRVEEESKDDGRTWAPTLYLLRTSGINGQQYEVIYHRN